MTEMNKLSIQEMKAQLAVLQAQIAEASAKETNEALDIIRDLIAEHSLTAQQIFPSNASTTSLKTKRVDDSSGNEKVRKEAPVKYFNPANGDKWSGRGLKPKWIKNAEQTPGGKDQYLLKVPVLAENLPQI